jgi:hypothetical protein
MGCWRMVGGEEAAAGSRSAGIRVNVASAAGNLRSDLAPPPAAAGPIPLPRLSAHQRSGDGSGPFPARLRHRVDPSSPGLSRSGLFRP